MSVSGRNVAPIPQRKKVALPELEKNMTYARNDDDAKIVDKSDGVPSPDVLPVHRMSETESVDALMWIQSYSLNLDNIKDATKRFVAVAEHQSRETPLNEITSLTRSLLSAFIGGTIKGLASIISALIIEDELQNIADQLEAIANELAKISDLLDEAINEIKVSVEFNTWLTAYVQWEFAIRNGEEKLSWTLAELGSTSDGVVRLKLIRDYVNYFEANDIEGAIRNIHRVSGLDPTPTTNNLFQLYSKEKDYNPKELTNLMIVLTDVIISGSVQIMTYYTFKYGVDKAMGSLATNYAILDDIRIQYEYHVWYILRDFRERAKADIESVLNEQESVNDQLELTKAIQQTLTAHYYWFSWSVVFISSTGLYNEGTYECRGGDYIYMENAGPWKNKYIVAVWQDISLPLSSCSQVMAGNTLVFLASTEGQHTDRIVSSENMMTVTACWSQKESVQYAYLGTSTTYYMPVWIATEAYQPSITCSQSSACSGHGQCLLVPSSPLKLCICENSYYGENCESRAEFEVGNFSGSLLTSLRKRHIVKALDRKINDGNRKIMDVLSYLKAVVGHVDVINKAEYIRTRYGQLLDMVISEDQFSYAMTGFVRKESVDYILLELQNTLLGVGVFDHEDGDILTAFKKAYVARRGYFIACTEEYASDVSEMIARLLDINQMLYEAMNFYLDWLLQNYPDTERDALIKEVFSYVAEFQTRREHYIQAWTAESCPTLDVPELIQNYCSEMMSYDGLMLELKCGNQKVAEPDKIACIRNGTQLIWSQIPTCVYDWGEWGDWSACDKTCGGGNQTRVRTSPNGDRDEDYRPCNTESCCQGR